MQEVLLQQVTQQGDNLHFVALAAAQMQSTDMPDMAKSLMQDLEVSCSQLLLLCELIVVVNTCLAGINPYLARLQVGVCILGPAWGAGGLCHRHTCRDKPSAPHTALECSTKEAFCVWKFPSSLFLAHAELQSGNSACRTKFLE
jgi:hypothetical protein